MTVSLDANIAASQGGTVIAKKNKEIMNRMDRRYRKKRAFQDKLLSKLLWYQHRHRRFDG